MCKVCKETKHVECQLKSPSCHGTTCGFCRGSAWDHLLHPVFLGVCLGTPQKTKVFLEGAALPPGLVSHGKKHVKLKRADGTQKRFYFALHAFVALEDCVR